MIAEERVIGVLARGLHRREARVLGGGADAAAGVAAEAALALERLRSATALSDALEREQTRRRRSRLRIRAELDPEGVIESRAPSSHACCASTDRDHPELRRRVRHPIVATASRSAS